MLVLTSENLFMFCFSTEKLSRPPSSPEAEHLSEALHGLLSPSPLPAVLLVKPAVNTCSETVATKQAGNKEGDCRQSGKTQTTCMNPVLNLPG